MPIEFDCPNCGRHYKVADSNAGKRFACKDCGQPATVPGGAAPQVAAPPAQGGYEQGYDDDYAEYDEQGYEQGYDEQGYGDQSYDQGYAAPQPRLPQPRMPGQRGPGGPGRPRLPGGRGPGGPRRPMGHGGGAPRPYGHGGYGGGRPMGPQKPHRGGMVFAFAMLGWFICGIFSIVALIMSSSDLKEMRAGTMDKSGEGLTKASYYLSIVAVAFMVLGLVLGVVLVLAGGMSSSRSSQYQQQRYQQNPRYSTVPLERGYSLPPVIPNAH